MDTNVDVNALMQRLADTESLIEKQKEKFSQIFLAHQELTDLRNDLKTKIKEAMKKSGQKKISTTTEVGTKIDVTYSEAIQVLVDDLDAIPVEYLDEEELPDVFMKNDKFYHYIGNTALAKEQYKLDESLLPEGFTVKITPRVSIKIDNKAV